MNVLWILTVQTRKFNHFSFIISLGMKEGLNTLRLFFYANLLNGQRDSSDIIEAERKYNEKSEIELLKRRRQQSDDINDDRKQKQNEQVQPSGENASEASTSPRTPTTTATATTSSTTTGMALKSTNELNDIESPIENTLQTKLGLRISEYRHGQYPFDIFVNEFANEKLEIKKEYLNFFQRASYTVDFSFIFYAFFLSTTNKIGNDILILIS